MAPHSAAVSKSQATFLKTEEMQLAITGVEMPERPNPVHEEAHSGPGPQIASRFAGASGSPENPQPSSSSHRPSQVTEASGGHEAVPHVSAIVADASSPQRPSSSASPARQLQKAALKRFSERSMIIAYLPKVLSVHLAPHIDSGRAVITSVRVAAPGTRGSKIALWLRLEVDNEELQEQLDFQLDSAIGANDLIM